MPSILLTHSVYGLSVIVLNLIITGIPSIQRFWQICKRIIRVLNLIITGIPSIPVPKPSGNQKYM